MLGPMQYSCSAMDEWQKFQAFLGVRGSHGRFDSERVERVQHLRSDDVFVFGDRDTRQPAGKFAAEIFSAVSQRRR